MRRTQVTGILLFCLLALLFTLPAYADSRSGDFSYKLNQSNEAVITKYSGNATELVIPDTLDGHTVVEIGKQAFYSSEVEKVSIPSSVITIGSYAFGYSDDLQEVTTFATLIKDHAFTYCSELETVNLLSEETIVESQGFYSCDNLETVNGTIVDPDSYSFGYCSNLMAITIGGSKVKDHAFTYCTDLETVTITGESIVVEDQAFYSCDKLTTVNGIVADVGSYAFGYDGSLKSITISGEEIQDHAFTYCSSLETVNLVGESIKVKDQAFYSCDRLKTFNGTVVDVGSYAFGYDGKLESITVSGELVGDHAFTYCEKLKTVTLVTPYVEIDDQVFYSCEKLETVNGIIGNVGSYGFGYCQKLTSLTFAGTSIEDNAFTYCNKLMLSIPNDPQVISAVQSANVHYTTVDGLSVPSSSNTLPESEKAESSENAPDAVETSSGEWKCPTCGNLVSGNFCNNCGTKKPVVEETATSIITAQPTTAPTAAPTAVPETRSTSDLTLESVVRYMLAPNDSSLSVNIIDMGEGTFSAMSSKGQSYLGMVEDDGDTYVIELMATGTGNSYSTEDSPYDYNSQNFKDVLNFLLKDDGKTIVSIIPMYGTMLSALDSSGKSYLVEIMYSEAMIMIGLLSM